MADERKPTRKPTTDSNAKAVAGGAGGRGNVSTQDVQDAVEQQLQEMVDGGTGSGSDGSAGERSGRGGLSCYAGNTFVARRALPGPGSARGSAPASTSGSRCRSSAAPLTFSGPPGSTAPGRNGSITHHKRTLAALCIAAASVTACGSGPTAPSPTGSITAADVVDRPTLKGFVDRAVAETERQANNRNEAYAFFDANFRPVGEWNRDSIYLWVYELDGTCFFNAANQSLETQNLWELEDKNSVKIIQALIAAATSGGGYVEYLWENPAVTGDEEEGSRKVGYAVLLNTRPDRFMIGSGIYP